MEATAAPFDMASLLAQMTQMREERAEESRQARAILHGELIALGVDRVEAHYDAYGDSGNVETVSLLQVAPAPVTQTDQTPAEQPWKIMDLALPEEMMTRLQDFLWLTVYALHPGFENNDGGFGELAWDLPANLIHVDHNERFTDINHYSYEDL